MKLLSITDTTTKDEISNLIFRNMVTALCLFLSTLIFKLLAYIPSIVGIFASIVISLIYLYFALVMVIRLCYICFPILRCNYIERNKFICKVCFIAYKATK